VGSLLLAHTIRFEFDYRFDSLIFGFSRKYPLSNCVSYSTLPKRATARKANILYFPQFVDPHRDNKVAPRHELTLRVGDMPAR
jgi:hypothetical protein